MIRTATIEDVYACADLIYRCAIETSKHRIPSYDDLIEDVVSQFMTEIYWHCVYEEDGEVLGIGAVMFIPYKWNREHQRAIEVAYHADPKLPVIKKGKICLKLIEFMEDECKKRNVDTFTIGTVPELNGMDRWIEKRGFELSEKHFIKEYNHV